MSPVNRRTRIHRVRWTGRIQSLAGPDRVVCQGGPECAAGRANVAGPAVPVLGQAGVAGLASSAVSQVGDSG